jgi:uncharacterized Zn-binding protein involved in type VI secretion
MPAAARGNGKDSVNTGHGCDTTTVTEQCSSKVFVNGIGVVREGDAVQTHTFPVGPSCVPHAPVMDGNMASRIIVEGKRVAMVGSTYSGHAIVTGAGNVTYN